MLILQIIGLIFCLVVACYAITKILKCALNLRAIYRDKKEPENTLKKASMVYNKKTKKLEADNHEVLPFE